MAYQVPNKPVSQWTQQERDEYTAWVNSPEKEAQETAQLAAAPVVDVPHYMANWGEVATLLEAKAVADRIGEDAFQAINEAKSKASGARGWVQENIMPTFEGVMDWASAWSTPPSRALEPSGTALDPFISAGKGFIGGVARSALITPYEDIETWISGKPATSEEQSAGARALAHTVTDPFYSLGGGIISDWFKLPEQGRNFRQSNPVNAWDKAAALRAKQKPSKLEEWASDVQTTLRTGVYGIQTVVPMVLAGTAILPIAAAGLGGWALRRAIGDVESAVKDITIPEPTPSPQPPKDGGPGYTPSPYPPNYEPPKFPPILYDDDFWRSAFEPPTIINVPGVIPGLIDLLDGQDETRSSEAGMAGGGAAFFRGGRKLTKKKRKKESGHRRGRAVSEDVRRMKTSLRTAARPSPSQSMGGGKGE